MAFSKAAAASHAKVIVKNWKHDPTFVAYLLDEIEKRLLVLAERQPGIRKEMDYLLVLSREVSRLTGGVV